MPTVIEGGLTNLQHEKFAQLFARGVDATEAYKKAYPGSKGASAQAAASRLLKTVMPRVQGLRGAAVTETVMDITEKRMIAAEVARDKEQRAADRIAAIMADAKLAGELSDTVNVNLRQPLTPEQILAAVQRSPALAALGRS